MYIYEANWYLFSFSLILDLHFQCSSKWYDMALNDTCVAKILVQ